MDTCLAQSMYCHLATPKFHAIAKRCQKKYISAVISYTLYFDTRNICKVYLYHKHFVTAFEGGCLKGRSLEKCLDMSEL